MITTNTGTYKTMSEAAAAQGVKRTAIYARAKRKGISTEEALNLGAYQGAKITKNAAIINGVHYKSFRDFCDKTGSNYNQLYRRLKKAGGLQEMMLDIQKSRESGLLAARDGSTVVDITITHDELSIYATLRSSQNNITLECNGFVREIAPSNEEQYLAQVVNAIASATKLSIGTIEQELSLIDIKRVQHDPISGITRITTKRI